MRHLAFAAAMGLVTAAILAPGSSSQAATADPTGYWYKPDAVRESKIQVFKCGAGKSQLCAKIIWLKDPIDSKGKPLHDIRNEDPSMHDRPIVGLTLFSGMAPSAPQTWTGKIYNPEDGHTYAATLTMLSRSEIKLRGCKAWLLCGEKQWLRTSAPPAAVPATAPEGTQQIEASATPNSTAPAPAAAVAAATPAVPPKAEVAAVTPSMEAATDQAAAMNAAPAAAPAPASAAPAPTMEAAADPAPQAGEPMSTESLSTPVALVTPAPQGSAEGDQRGYGFLNASATSDTAAQYTGDNVTSMFKMTSPVATQGAAPAQASTGSTPGASAAATPAVAPSGAAQPAAATQASADDPVPLPDQKPKAKVKPHAVAANTAAKATQGAADPSAQGAPVPQEETAQADTEAQAAQADMTEPAPLTRRQMRRLRKQQEQQEPFLPWLR
jgi:uncharacterized protein (DUF2147 family)